MYRIHRALDVNGKIVERGMSELAEVAPGSIRKLLEAGIISKVAAPPLTEFPGWSHRAAKLLAEGIIDAEQFLRADDAHLAHLLRTNAGRVAAWKDEVRGYLTASPRKN